MASLYYMDYDSWSSFEQDLVAGDNTFEISDGVYTVQVKAKDGYIVKGLTCEGESIGSSSNLNYSFSNFSAVEGKTIYADVQSLADARSATCHIKVDNPSKVQIRRSYTYTYVDIPETEDFFDATFMPDSESPFQIGTQEYGSTLYKVVKNGEEIPNSSAQYVNVDVADGDYIEVYANYPDIDCNVTFQVTEGAEGFLTQAKAGDDYIENFLDGFTVKAGTKVLLYGDTDNYKYKEITINGQALSYFYGYTSFVVAENTVITVDAEKYQDYVVHVNVDDPSRLKLWLNYDSYNPVELVAGDNEVTMNDNANVMTFQAADDCYIVSISDGETEYYEGYSTTYIYGKEGMSLTVTTGAVQLDKQFCFYIDDSSAATYGFYFMNTNYSDVNYKDGDYTLVNFDLTYNPYTMYCYGMDSFWQYLGGELKQNFSSSNRFTLADKDVFKVFLLGEPAQNTINVTYPTSGVQEVKIDKDYLSEVESGAESFTAVGNTLVRVYVTAEEGVTPAVLFNNVAAEYNEESGAYEFTATEAGDLVISGGESGVTLVNAANANNNVYSIDGVMLFRNASQEQISTLPAGLYIINNKKVVVRK
jgi:hypothetical protein